MNCPELFEWMGTLLDRLRSHAYKSTFFYCDYLIALGDGHLEQILRNSVVSLPLMRATFFSWNNSPRYGVRSTSVDHEGVSTASLDALHSVKSDAGFPVLLNSWNEWSEGAALEPAQREHRLRAAFFEALASVQQQPPVPGWATAGPVGTD